MPHSIKDMIESSKLIRSGPPALYQLETTKTCIKSMNDGISGLKRWTVGDTDQSKPNKTILLVGETGTGKSTLINAMVNYVMGVEWEDEVWFKIVEESAKSPSESLTSEVTVYEIFGFESGFGYSLTFIDTPGYGNSLNDSQITKMLCDLLNSTNVIDTIDAVCLVMKATEFRLHDKLKYNLQLINSLLSEDMKDHIVVLLTHSDGMPAKNALRALEYSTFQCAMTKTNEPVHFLFNNSSPDFTITEQTKIALHLAWKVTKTGMQGFSDFLNGAAPQNVKHMAVVLQEHVDLSTSVAKLQDSVKSIEFKQRDMQQVQKALMESTEGLSQNQNHTRVVEKIDTEKVQINSCCFCTKAINCTACEKTCYYPYNDMNVFGLLHNRMENYKCIECSCDSDKHKIESFRYEITTKVVTNIDQDMKLQYEKHQKEQETNSAKLLDLQREMMSFEEDKAKWLEEAYGHVVKLEAISLNTSFLSSHTALAFLIDKMKQTGDKEKAQRLEDIKRRKGQEEKPLIDL